MTRSPALRTARRASYRGTRRLGDLETLVNRGPGALIRRRTRRVVTRSVFRLFR